MIEKLVYPIYLIFARNEWNDSLEGISDICDGNDISDIFAKNDISDISDRNDISDICDINDWNDSLSFQW